MRFALTPSWARVLIPLGVVLLTLALAASRKIITPGFYFADDTQLGALGQWWELGDHLLSGRVPVLNPQVWQAGNYFAEGQWGLINPVTWIIAIAVRSSTDALLIASVVKLVFLAAMALGTYFLAREFGASPLWAAVAGTAAPIGGFSAYMDAPSWVTGLMTTALFPWVWWTYRRVVAGRSPLPFLAASYLLVTVGYVFGVIVLVFVLVESLIRSTVTHRWLEFRRGMLASIWAGLWTVVVYLPGVLTAPVTKRGSFEIINGGFLNADLSDFGAAATPTASGTVFAWSGPVTPGPLVYIAWFLPLLPMLAPWLRTAWSGLHSPLIIGAIVFAIVLGPSDIGPIRWPVRFMPYLVIAAVVIFAVLATRGYPRSVTRRSILASALTAVAANWLAWALTPQSWRSIAACLAIQLAVIALLAGLERGRRGWSRSISAMPAAALVVLAVTAGVVFLQMRVFPFTPLPTFAVPTQTTPMRDVLADADGDVMTVGDATASAFEEESYDERLIANLWYLSDATVSNTYTVLPFATFSDDLCIDLKGNTCDDTLSTLFERDRETGARVVDLLAVNEILAYTATYPNPPRALPAGWRLIDEGETTWRIGRDAEVASAGGVVWTGDGTEVTTISESEDSISLRVDAVGDDARVTFSRLSWPGYGVDRGVLVDPVRDYLLTIDVATSAPGDIVTVTFKPPGALLEAAAAASAIVLVAGWLFVRFELGRRARRTERAMREYPTATGS